LAGHKKKVGIEIENLRFEDRKRNARVYASERRPFLDRKI
jgi:hypothetical protein